MPQLVITHPSHDERRVDLVDDEYVLGRDPQVAIPLRDRKVSRRHARVFRRGGSYYIEDLGSVNGVLLGGQPLNGARKMNPGVELDVGGFGVKLLSDNAREQVTFTLTGRVPPVRDQVFMLPIGELEVGRVEGAAIVIPDVSVSRTHAVLTVEPGSVIVEDLSSSNGTFVNGVKVGRRELKAGDTVRFGNIDFKFGRAGRVSFARAKQYWQGFANSDSTVKLAAGIGGLSMVLLVVVVIIAAKNTSARAPDGMSPAEAAYGRMVEDGLLRGREEAGRGHWEEAAKAFNQVLDGDPVNLAAHDGLASIDQGRDSTKALEQARTALNQNRPRLALDLADSIPLRSPIGKEAVGVAASARTLLATDAYNSAQGLCRDRQWVRCREKVIEHLRYKPESVSGKALLGEVESSMRDAKMRFTPYQPPQTPEELALQARYPDAEVREIVLSYMGGDVSTAIERARAQSGREAVSRLLSSLVEIQRTRDAAEQAAAASESQRVVRLLEHCLAIDATIMPASQSSTVSSNLQRKIASELYDLGENAQIRGDKQEAFLHWYKAQSYAPDNETVIRALNRLETEAAEVLARADGKDPASCARLQTVLTVTKPDSSVHLAAKSKLNECR